MRIAKSEFRTRKRRLSSKSTVDLLEALATAAEGAARTVKRYYSPYPTSNQFARLHATAKDKTDPRTVVSRADLASEKVIVSVLGRELKCTFLSEEAGVLEGRPDAEFRVIIDSLDGSRNFVQGANGLFGISIGVERDGRLVAGAIALPYFDELLICERGRGVYFKPLKRDESRKGVHRVTQPKEMPSTLATARINVGRGAAPAKVLTEPPLSLILETANESTNYASCAVGLAAVALTRIDGLVLPRQRYWDFAAGSLIIKELGGKFGIWRDNWRSQAEESELAGATEQSYFDIAATLQPALFEEISRTNGIVQS